jgi:hypothetical protein
MCPCEERDPDRGGKGDVGDEFFLDSKNGFIYKGSN